MAYADVHDVEIRLMRTLTDAERELAEVLLEDVEALIRARIPDLDERVASGDIPESIVVSVEANAVARVLRNPGGMRQEADGNYSYSVDTRVAAGYLSLLDSDWWDLGLRGAFTIEPYLDTTPNRPFAEYDLWRAWL